MTGRHVVIHWDSSENQLCGGTLEYVDASLEIMAQTYGVDLPAEPNTDIFWSVDDTLVEDACWGLAFGCNLYLPNGRNMLVTWSVSDPHELAHTINLTGTGLDLPSFFAEGVASRWERGLGTWEETALTYYRWDLSYSQVLAWLREGRIPGDVYGEADFLWSWLEAQYGPHAMKEFTSRIDMFSSTARIEREFEATFGVTLKMAIDTSHGQPLMVFDSHPCSMTHLPTLVWAGEPLVLSAGPSTCAADDVVNTIRGPARFERLELGEVWRPYLLELTGPMWDAIGGAASIHFHACKGEPTPYEDPIERSPIGSDLEMWLGGTYVVIVTGPFEDDGTVQFPVARLKPQ